MIYRADFFNLSPIADGVALNFAKYTQVTGPFEPEINWSYLKMINQYLLSNMGKTLYLACWDNNSSGLGFRVIQINSSKKYLLSDRIPGLLGALYFSNNDLNTDLLIQNKDGGLNFKSTQKVSLSEVSFSELREKLRETVGL